MRLTVLIIDCIFLFPSVYLICKKWTPICYRNKPLFNALIFMILIKPDQILIDHGHFQYNCLMLGLILYSFYFLINENRYLCCLTFTLAMNCKLMSTYFSLAFLAGLIGLTYKRYGRQRKLKIIRECFFYALIVIFTLLVLWIPWLRSYKDFSSVLTAIFPVHRGLYQLKVPNFWCISDVLLKW
jgi:alpha-1,3-glucosyltransferase